MVASGMNTMFSNCTALNKDFSPWSYHIPYNVFNEDNVLPSMFEDTLVTSYSASPTRAEFSIPNEGPVISLWNVSNGTNMKQMFRLSHVFNQDYEKYPLSHHSLKIEQE